MCDPEAVWGQVESGPSESLFLDAQNPFSARSQKKKRERKCDWSTEQVPALLWHLVPCLCQDAPAALGSVFLALHLNLLFITHAHAPQAHTNCRSTTDVSGKHLFALLKACLKKSAVWNAYKLRPEQGQRFRCFKTSVQSNVFASRAFNHTHAELNVIVNTRSHSRTHLALTPAEEHMSPPKLLWESV